jgi:hypothetical protein
MDLVAVAVAVSMLSFCVIIARRRYHIEGDCQTLLEYYANKCQINVLTSCAPHAIGIVHGLGVPESGNYGEARTVPSAFVTFV